MYKYIYNAYVCVYMSHAYTHTHIHTHTHTHTHIHACTHTHIHAHTHLTEETKDEVHDSAKGTRNNVHEQRHELEPPPPIVREHILS